jgi:predicted nucleic acid-binding protein
MKLQLKSGDSLFLDTAPLVYFWEKRDPYYEKMVSLFDQVYALGLQCTVSLLTYTEVINFPLKNRKPRLAAKYRDYLTNSANINLYPFNLLVADKTAFFMAKYDLKMESATQLATAAICGADYVLTNNRDWQKVKSLRILTVGDL